MAHPDILDERDPLGRPVAFAVALHVAVLASLSLYNWIGSRTESFGSKDAGGGSIGIQAVDSIPLPHTGMANPVANDTESQVPQDVSKPVPRAKKEVVSKDAIPLKTREKKRLADVASERQKFRPFKEIDQNQVYAKQAPQVSNPMFSAKPGSGRIGTGPNSPLGTRFAGYAQQIQELISQKWRTGDVDPSLQTAPTVIATFDLMRDGSIKNLVILQKSGNYSLDNSVQRAVLEASPFPPIPPGYEKDSAKVEFWFELKR
jgi:periplasmic protein TonB